MWNNNEIYAYCHLVNMLLKHKLRAGVEVSFSKIREIIAAMCEYDCTIQKFTMHPTESTGHQFVIMTYRKYVIQQLMSIEIHLPEECM